MSVDKQEPGSAFSFYYGIGVDRAFFYEIVDVFRETKHSIDDQDGATSVAMEVLDALVEMLKHRAEDDGNLEQLETLLRGRAR